MDPRPPVIMEPTCVLKERTLADIVAANQVVRSVIGKWKSMKAAASKYKRLNDALQLLQNARKDVEAYGGHEYDLLLEWMLGAAVNAQYYLIILFTYIQMKWQSKRPHRRKPSCSPMPWDILPSLIVLWGVCWMFTVVSPATPVFGGIDVDLLDVSEYLNFQGMLPTFVDRRLINIV
jgi:hypothetical protein